MRHEEFEQIPPQKPIQPVEGPERGANFSLPCLFVTIVCFGILATILLPAVGSRRTPARRAFCANQLRQLSLAAHNYHDAYRRLPTNLCASGAVLLDEFNNPGSSNYKWNQQHTSTIAMLLPFFEQQNLYESMDPIFFDFRRDYSDYLDSQNKPIYRSFMEDSGYWETAFTDIPELTCPSDLIEDANAYVIVATQPVYENDLGAISEDKISAVYFDWPETTSTGKTQFMGRTNYLACAGVNSGGRNRIGVHKQLIGCMGPREKRTLEDIPDGTSQTIMFGESLGEIRRTITTENPERILVHSFLTGGLARGRSSLSLFLQGSRENPMLGHLSRSSWTGFGSAHASGVNMAMADGSLHLISRDIDWQVFYSECAEADGQQAWQDDSKDNRLRRP